MLSLAEAILLGSTMVKPIRGTVYEQTLDGQEYGCALGMAYKALGCAKDGRYTFPYVMESLLETQTQLPCNCDPGITYALSNAIVHLFDSHVVIDGKAPRLFLRGFQRPPYSQPWTLEELVDWVRTQEAKIQPTEEAKDADRVTDHAQCSH